MDAYLKVLTVTPPLPSTDFVVAVPQVLHALCLTHDGAARVQEANVFPSVRQTALAHGREVVIKNIRVGHIFKRCFVRLSTQEKYPIVTNDTIYLT